MIGFSEGGWDFSFSTALNIFLTVGGMFFSMIFLLTVFFIERYSCMNDLLANSIFLKSRVISL